MKKYICIKRAKFKGLDGDFNIPYGTELDCKNGCLISDGKMVCLSSSENARQFFSCNNDGNGLLRGKLVHSIIDTLAKNDTQHQFRWDKVWADRSVRKYKDMARDDYWLWNQYFYEAPIEDLKHIVSLVGAKEV